MKPLHYIKKHKFVSREGRLVFDHNAVIEDLTLDFMALLEVGNASKSLKGYESAVRAIRMKWDGINKKVPGELPEKLWNYFYATRIAKLREEFFPKEMEYRRKEKREREQRRKEWERDRYFGGINFENLFEFWFSNLLSSVQKISVPTNELEILQLNSTATEEDIKKSYRRLSMIHHPDKGGKQETFVEISRAKNLCLAWSKNKNQ